MENRCHRIRATGKEKIENHKNCHRLCAMVNERLVKVDDGWKKKKVAIVLTVVNDAFTCMGYLVSSSSISIILGRNVSSSLQH
jgi:predicted secreted protein